MQTEKKRPVQSINEPMAFHFNATSQEIRSFLIEKDPWFIAKDVCDVLGLSNSRKAISSLDDDVPKQYL
jgi:prophage antirepressor-like protein